MKSKEYKTLSEDEIRKYRKEYKILKEKEGIKARQEFKHRFFSLEGYSDTYKSSVWIRIVGR